jgi:hypothetical protein
VNHLPHIVHRTPEETTAQHPELHVFAGVIVGVMPLNQRPEYVCARLRNHHGVAKFGVVHLQLTSTVDTIGFLSMKDTKRLGFLVTKALTQNLLNVALRASSLVDHVVA